MAGCSCLSPFSILPATSQQRLPLATIGRSNGRISCHHKAEESKVTNRVEEQQPNRRDILRCFTTVVGLEMIAGYGPITETAIAADLIQRKQRSEFQASIKDTLYKQIKGQPELIPSILTLALNDAITYDKATKSGGANGSIRLKPEISRLENAGLSAALDLLVEAKKEIDSYSKGGPISYADLIQLAAQSAVKKTFLASAIRKCGGNEEKGNLLYTAFGSNSQWRLFDKEFGRTDSPDPDPEGRIPLWDKASVQEMKNKFSAIGFGPRQLAVMSAFLGPDQLAVENVLASDQEVRPWVEKYQRSRETVSQTDYEDAEIREKKNACYADIESGLWGFKCKSSVIEKENCALQCLSPACYQLIYESDPLEEGEKDYSRSHEYKYCLQMESLGESLEGLKGA